MTAPTAERAVTITSATPSGIEIQYQAEPKRLYRVRRALPPSDQSEPNTPWLEVPSVTTVLGVLDKPALPFWGMKIGVEGTLALFNQGHLALAYNESQPIAVVNGAFGTVVAGVEQVIELLTHHKLTVNHVRDKAGVRGVGVHDALELWAETGKLPDPAMFPPEETGYVRGLVAFLQDVPSAKATACEVMVGSVKHGFAGRYDVRIKTTEPHQVVIHRTPVKGPQYALLAPGEYLADLKSSKGVYSSHHRQLEAYEGASIECGYGSTRGRGILHVSAEGEYEFVRSVATYDDFLVVLGVWKSDEAMKGRKR